MARITARMLVSDAIERKSELNASAQVHVVAEPGNPTEHANSLRAADAKANETRHTRVLE